MEGLKFIGSFTVLALLVLAVALSQARFAGDTATNGNVDVSAGLNSTLGDVLGQSESEEASDGELTDGDQNEGESSASVDVDSSSSFDFDFSSDVDIDVDGEGSASVEDGSSPSVKVGDATFTCNPGDDYRNSTARCENEDGDVDFRVDVDEDDFPRSFDVNLDINM